MLEGPILVSFGAWEVGVLVCVCVSVICLVIWLCVTSALIVSVVLVYMWVNVNVAVCDFVHKCEYVCLSVYVKQFHVYL